MHMSKPCRWTSYEWGDRYTCSRVKDQDAKNSWVKKSQRYVYFIHDNGFLDRRKEPVICGNWTNWVAARWLTVQRIFTIMHKYCAYLIFCSHHPLLCVTSKVCTGGKRCETNRGILANRGQYVPWRFSSIWSNADSGPWLEMMVVPVRINNHPNGNDLHVV